MNRDELRKRAAELNITGRGSMSKAELEQAVSEAEKDANTIVAGVGTLHTAPVGTSPDTFPEGWTEIGYTTDPGIEFPSVEGAHRMVETFNDKHPVVARRARHAARMAKSADRKRQERAAHLNTERQIIKKLRASASMVYGVGGRGMGAKHYASRSNPLPVPYVRPAIVGRGLTGAR